MKLENVNIMSKQEKKPNLCRCLYDTIINETDYCMLELDGVQYKHHNLDYVNEILYFIDDEYEGDCVDGIYSRLCLITNEQLNLDGIIYHRVYKIVYLRYELDLNIIRDKFNITIWSNCILSDDYNKFLTYWNGNRISNDNCPPYLNSIIESLVQYGGSFPSDTLKTTINELREYKKDIKISPV